MQNQNASAQTTTWNKKMEKPTGEYGYRDTVHRSKNRKDKERSEKECRVKTPKELKTSRERAAK